MQFRAFLAASTVALGLASPGLLHAQNLPSAVTGLDLQDVTVRQKPRVEYGRNVYGTLPSGAKVEIELDGQDLIKEIETTRRKQFSVADVRSLLPAAVLQNSAFPADATLEKIEFERDGRIELEGRLASGKKFDAEFRADGQLLDFDTDD